MTDILLNIEKSKPGKAYKKLNNNTYLLHAVMIFICILLFIPVLITLFTAFKSPAQVAAEFPLKPPTTLYFENFKYAIKEGNFLTGLKNSFFLVFISLVLNLVIGTTCAFVLGRFEFKAKKLIMGLFMVGLILPGAITEISRFVLISYIGVYNTMLAPIIIYAATDVLQLYIYLQFIETIPISLDESVRIDGGNTWIVFSRIIFPLLLPATATVGIIKAINVLNDMYVPYLYMPSAKLRTLTTILMDFNGAITGKMYYLSAAVVIVAIPTVLIFLCFQKYIFAGIVAGAVKE
jgi:multiple sugar transport system permease protein